MKIAVVTDDEKTIGAHFGRASKYVVFSVENGEIASREVREKVGHRQFAAEDQTKSHHHDDKEAGGRGLGKHAGERHRRMFANITDCAVLLARGMGRGAQLGLQQTGLKPILNDISDIDIAVEAAINGSIVDHPNRVH
ncbi:dinitrogenase iron-molybdenum cofactor biosynthesis protein [bacterium]|nr:dinitrogenase iron-molybdenum cofactor biosynthesis protein [bacterium]